MSTPPGDSTGAGTGAWPTIRDVARLAGVSPLTVSRVINGGQPVHPETTAQDDRALRNLTLTIGLLVDDIANPFFSALARAVEDSARLRDYLVLIGSSQNSLAREREVISAFCSRQVDGLIVVPSTGSHRFLAAQIERGTKGVCLDRPAA